MGENPVFLMMGNVYAYWYGVFILLGLISGIVLSCFMRQYQGGKSLSDLLITLIAALPAAFVGSRLYYCWNFTDVDGSKPGFSDFGNGGFSVHGAVLGAMIAIVLAAVVQRKNVGQMLDATVPGTALAIAIGRIGAQFVGENLGGIVDSEGLHSFPFSVYCEAEGVWRSSLFFYESLVALAICAASVFLFLKKYRDGALACRNGDIYLLFMVFFFVTQGCFEITRVDPLYFHVSTYHLWKLQTIQAGMIYGSIASALALSIMILRVIPQKGFNFSTILTLAGYAVGCAVSYFCYYNTVLRIEMPDPLPILLHLVGVLGLLAIASYLFYSQLDGVERPALPSRSPERDRAPRRAAPSQPRSRKPQYSDFWD